MPFSPATYLTEQGWEGKGHGLRKGSIRKPLTVAHKTNLAGLGKERDTGYAWWDDVFSLVANKTANSKTPESSTASSREGSAVADIRKTSTGIYSARPPAHPSFGAHPASGSATPNQVPHTSTSSAAFNADIIAQAKLEAARRELYSKFLRGRPLAGTGDDSDASNEAASDQVLSASSTRSGDVPNLSDKAQRAQDKIERRKHRAEKKAAKDLKRAKKEAQRKGKRTSASSDDESALLASRLSADTLEDTQAQPQSLSEQSPKKQKKRKAREHDPAQDHPTSSLVQSDSRDSTPPDMLVMEAKSKRSKAEKAARKRLKFAGQA